LVQVSLVGKGDWSEAAVLAKVREQIVPSMAPQGAVLAWIFDDTGSPKKGGLSVGDGKPCCA